MIEENLNSCKIQQPNVSLNNQAIQKQSTLNNLEQNTSEEIKKKNVNTPPNEDNKEENKICKPLLRKKICIKLAKYLQEIYLMERYKSQELSIFLEKKIRLSYPKMELKYKNSIKNMFRILKVIDLFY